MTPLRSVRLILILTLLLALTLTVFGQTTQQTTQSDSTPTFISQWAGGGVLYANGVGGNGLFVYAHQITDNSAPTYLFTDFRVTGWQGNPFVRGTDFKLLTTQDAGVAQYLKTFGRFQIYALGLFGVSQTTNSDNTGTAIGNSVSAGGMAKATLHKTKSDEEWTLNPIILYNKTSLANNQWSVGVLFGWGK